MIPKILHQVWLGEKPIPSKFIDWLHGWQKLHPDWEYKLWTDNDLKDIRPLLIREYPESSKSNIARLYILEAYGGVYTDLDFTWLKNIDSLLDHNAFTAIEHTNLIGNSIFGAIPNHEWIQYQIELLPSMLNRAPPWGPRLMTLATRAKAFDVTVLSSDSFYPLPWHKREQINISIKEFPNSYAVHRWENSWMINIL